MKNKLYIVFFCLILLGLSGCNVNNATKNFKDELASVQNQGEHAEGNQAKSQTAVGLTKLEIRNGVGDIKITAGKEDMITVKANVKVQGAESEEQAKEILEKIELVQEKDKETASYYAAGINSKTTELGKWLRDTYGSKLSATISLTIVIPEHISEFALTDGVGNIMIVDSQVSGTISSGVGDIQLDQVALKEKTEIISGTGNIKLIARKIDQVQSFHAVAGVGDINVTLPEKASYSVDVTSFMKDNVKQDYNGGGPLFTLDTSVGNVKLNDNEVK